MKDTIDTPDGIEWLGVSLKTILAPDATGGAMSIVDTVAPVGFSPPRHIHHAEDEIFVVLTGEMDVWINGEITRAGPGDAAFVPRGTEHSFLVNGDRPCRGDLVDVPACRCVCYGYEYHAVDHHRRTAA